MSSPSPDDGDYSGKSFFICSADGNQPSDSGIMVILSDDSGNGWDDGSNIGRDR